MPLGFEGRFGNAPQLVGKIWPSFLFLLSLGNIYFYPSFLKVCIRPCGLFPVSPNYSLNWLTCIKWYCGCGQTQTTCGECSQLQDTAHVTELRIRKPENWGQCLVAVYYDALNSTQNYSSGSMASL